MPPKKSKTKSVWRSDKAQHFQVVHRSQRDPLINDPEAGQHVLKAVGAPNAKGKTRAQLEQELGQDGKPLRANVGEAALYGVYYDDSEYDYMQHLRPIRDNENSRRGGEDEVDDTQAILLSAPKPKSEAKNDERIRLPASALPSTEERPFSYTSHLNVEPALQGFQPDMDPHLRQALEALDDDAFVDGELDDDFFGDVVKGGEWDGKEGSDEEWRNLPPEGDEAIWMDPGQRAQQEQNQLGDQELSLEARVALFKKAQQMEKLMSKADKPTEEEEEERDQLRSLPAGSRTGSMYTAGGSILGKKGRPGARARRAASTKAGSTAWSMSSSSMTRNKGLSDLDDHFDKIGRQYGIREDWDPALDDLSDFDEEEEGEVVTRKDFDNIMDEFLNKYEVIAGKLKERLGAPDATGDEKLDMIRKALGNARIDGQEWQGKGGDEPLEEYESDKEEPEPLPIPRSHQREKWDVETVLTTKTNVENHPRTISARESVMGNGNSARPGKIVNTMAPSFAGSVTTSQYGKPNAAAFLDDDERLPKIKIEPRTGFPMIVGFTKPKKAKHAPSLPELDEDGPPPNDEEESEGSDYDSDATEGPRNETIKRDRKESKEEKKARKEAVKAAKQERREQKALLKKTFASEKNRQAKGDRARKEAEGGPNGMRLL